MGPQIYIAANNQVYGPYEFAHVQAGVRRGEIQPPHMLSYDGRQWFPAEAIWPQLLGQAGFGPSAVGQLRPAAPVAQGRPVAQARPAPQAQYAATPAQSTAPGVAQSAETVDAAACEFASWPGRVVIAIVAFVFLYVALLALTFLATRLPEVGDMIRSSSYWTFMENAATPMQGLRGAAVVAVSVWAYFAARDLTLRNVSPPPPSPGWACGWFYVPFANLFMPPAVLQRLWKSSDWTLRGGTRRAAGTMLIPIWWYGIVVCNAAMSVVVFSYTYFHANVDRMIMILNNKAPLFDRVLYQIWQGYLKAVPVFFVIDLVAWTVGLGLFVSFQARVRTRVEMG